MKKFIDNLVGVVVLVLVAYLVAKNLFNINIKNPFTGKSEVPESIVEAMVVESAGALGYDESEYTWEVKHSPDRDRHQDTVEVALFCSNENGSVTYRRKQTYQYYKENDIWETFGDGYEMAEDKRWNLEELINGKTFSDTDDKGNSYTITLSDLDMAAQTVTATYRYRFNSYTDWYSDTYSDSYYEYYIANLDGERVDELSGTVECYIEGDENWGYSIEEVVGYEYMASNRLYVDRLVTKIAIRLYYNDPLRFYGVSVSEGNRI